MEKDLALIEQFLDALWLEKNLAENTLSAYRRDLTLLVEWLAHRGLTLESAQSDDLQGLLAERMEGVQSHQLRTSAERHAPPVPAPLPREDPRG